MRTDALPGLETSETTDESDDDQLPTRAQINARAETAFYSVAQTFLSEFAADRDRGLYPAADGRTVACDGGEMTVYYRAESEHDRFHRLLGCLLGSTVDYQTATVEEARAKDLRACGNCSAALQDDQPVATDGGTTTEDGDSPFFLNKKWLTAHLDITGAQASAIRDHFLTKRDLLDALENGVVLRSCDGIGEKTATAIWKWYKNVYEGSVEPDGNLTLTDDGLELPEWLVGFTGTFVLRTPSITMRASTTDHGLPPVSKVVLANYPDDGEWDDRLEAGMIALETPTHRECIYEIDDQRTDEGGDE